MVGVLATLILGTVIVLMLSWSALTRTTNDLHHRLVSEVGRHVADATTGRILRAGASTEMVAARLAAQPHLAESPEELLDLLEAALRAVPELSSVYVGQPNGRMVQVRRELEPDGWHVIRRLRSVGGVDTWHWVRGPGDRVLTRLEPTPFDPRIRPWYTEATSELTWTDPYVFYTLQLPGITASQRVTDLQGKLLGVVGSDVPMGTLPDMQQVSGRNPRLLPSRATPVPV